MRLILTSDAAMIEYVAYQLNTDLSRAAEGTGPVKPDNLRVSARCQILRENRKIRVQRSELSALGAFIFQNKLDGMVNTRNCNI